MKKLFLTLGLCIAVSVAYGQKRAVADALRLATDAQPNIGEARTKIKAALENAETKNDPKTWFTAGKIESIVIDGEISKQIVTAKQPDEAVLYGALENLYPYFLKAYELDNLPNEKGKIKPKYTKDMRIILKADLPYYINAGAYFFEKQDFKKTYHFFNEYVEISDSKLLKEEEKAKKTNDPVPVDSNYIMANHYAAVASSQLNDPALAFAAMKRARTQDYKQEEIIQYLAEEYKNAKDTANFEITLGEGLALFPKEAYFLFNLINTYIQTGRNEKALEHLNMAIAGDPNNANLYDVAGRIYESNLKDSEKAEEYFIKSVELDGENAETQSNLGRIYFNQAVNQVDVANSIQDAKKYNEEKEKAHEFFRKALPYFEKSLQLNPDVQETKVALRNIYYNLNMGEKLAEIEKLLETN